MADMRARLVGLALAAVLGSTHDVSAATLTSDSRRLWTETDIPVQNHNGTITYQPVLATADAFPPYSPFTASVTNPSSGAITAAQDSTVSSTYMQATGSASSISANIFPFAFSVFEVAFSLDHPVFAGLTGQFDLSSPGSFDPAQLASSVVLSSGPNTLFSGSGPLAVGSQPFEFSGTLPAGNYKLFVETRVRATQATLAYRFGFNVPEPSPLVLAAGAALALVWIASRRQRA